MGSNKFNKTAFRKDAASEQEQLTLRKAGVLLPFCSMWVRLFLFCSLGFTSGSFPLLLSSLIIRNTKNKRKDRFFCFLFFLPIAGHMYFPSLFIIEDNTSSRSLKKKNKLFQLYHFHNKPWPRALSPSLIHLNLHLAPAAELVHTLSLPKLCTAYCRWPRPMLCDRFNHYFKNYK